MAATPLSLSRLDADPLMSNGCAQVDAIREQTEAMREQTATMSSLLAAIQEGVEAFRPAADEIRDLGQAQKKLCAFIVGNRLKITAATIGLLVGVGAISPSAGEALQNFFKTLGLL